MKPSDYCFDFQLGTRQLPSLWPWFSWGDARQAKDLHRENLAPAQPCSSSSGAGALTGPLKNSHTPRLTTCFGDNALTPEECRRRMCPRRWSIIAGPWSQFAIDVWQQCCSKIWWPCLQSAGPHALAQWCWSFKCFESSKLGLLRERGGEVGREMRQEQAMLLRKADRNAPQHDKEDRYWIHGSQDWKDVQRSKVMSGWPFPTAHHLINRICFQLHQPSSCQAKAAGIHPFIVTACGDWRGSAMSPNQFATQTQSCPESVCSANVITALSSQVRYCRGFNDLGQKYPKVAANFLALPEKQAEKDETIRQARRTLIFRKSFLFFTWVSFRFCSIAPREFTDRRAQTDLSPSSSHVQEGQKSQLWVRRRGRAPIKPPLPVIAAPARLWQQSIAIDQLVWASVTSSRLFEIIPWQWNAVDNIYKFDNLIKFVRLLGSE